jgi:hypothetical protein
LVENYNNYSHRLLYFLRFCIHTNTKNSATNIHIIPKVNHTNDENFKYRIKINQKSFEYYIFNLERDLATHVQVSIIEIHHKIRTDLGMWGTCPQSHESYTSRLKIYHVFLFRMVYQSSNLLILIL